MKFDLSKFKKTQDDNDSAILQHPDGHHIRIAKGVLSKAMQDDLAKLPMHMAEGEIVEDPTDLPEKDPYASNPILSGMPTYDPKQAELNLLQDPNVGDSVKEEIARRSGLDLKAPQINSILPQTGGRIIDNSAQPEVSPLNVPSTKIQAPDNLIVSRPQAQPEIPLQPYAQEQLGAVKKQQEAEQNLAKQQAALYQQHALQEQADFDNYQRQESKYLNQTDSLAADYKNGHIDPQHFVKNMSTSQKITTAIGLILGGFNPASNQNQAVDFLNKQIDQDMESQKFEIGKSRSLMEFNRQQLGDLNAAFQMTKAQKLAILSDKLQQAAATANDPLAQARGMQSAALIKQQSYALTKQAALSSALSQGTLPSSVQGMLPPEIQQRSVKLPNGKLALAASKEDAEKSRGSFQTLDNINAGIDHIESLMNDNGRTVPYSEADYKAEDAQRAVALNLRQLFSLNRLNDTQLNEYLKMVPSAGAWRQDVAKGKLSELKNLVNNLKASEMNNYLSGTNQAPSIGGGDNMAPPNLSKITKKK